MFRVYFVSETAQVELESGRVYAPDLARAVHRHGGGEHEALDGAALDGGVDQPRRGHQVVAVVVRADEVRQTSSPGSAITGFRLGFRVWGSRIRVRIRALNV